MLASMLAAIAVQSKSAQWLKDGGQFVPYPATWLNDGCWQDDEPVGSESSVGELRMSLESLRNLRRSGKKPPACRWSRWSARADMAVAS